MPEQYLLEGKGEILIDKVPYPVISTVYRAAVSFIFLEGDYTSTSKFPHKQRELIKSIVAALTIKRIADNDIIEVIFDQTGKTITDRYLSSIRQQIKSESYHWYKTMRGLGKTFFHLSVYPKSTNCLGELIP